MIKIVGFIPMKKTKGAVVFTENDSVNGVHASRWKSCLCMRN